MRYFTLFLLFSFSLSACQKPLNVAERIQETDNFCAETDENAANYTVQTINGFVSGNQLANLLLVSNNKPVLLVYMPVNTVSSYEFYFYLSPDDGKPVYLKETGVDLKNGTQYESGFYYSHNKLIGARTRITSCNHTGHGEHNHNHEWTDYVPSREDDFRLNYKEVAATAKDLLEQFEKQEKGVFDL